MVKYRGKFKGETRPAYERALLYYEPERSTKYSKDAPFKVHCIKDKIIDYFSKQGYRTTPECLDDTINSVQHSTFHLAGATVSVAIKDVYRVRKEDHGYYRQEDLRENVEKILSVNPYIHIKLFSNFGLRDVIGKITLDFPIFKERELESKT